jgi:anaerobic dimethyl sulfoxide reductase subunit B (iron-sulfur subunit)
VACKNWNNLAPKTSATPGVQGPKWRRVLSVESGSYPNAEIVKLSLGCQHCGKPACVGVCPTGALSKRADDGVVVVDQNKCIGCRYCLFACPFGAPQYGEEGTMQKCNLCLGRLAEGKKPACVDSCPAKALHAGSLDDLAKLASGKAAQRLAGATLPSLILSTAK